MFDSIKYEGKFKGKKIKRKKIVRKQKIRKIRIELNLIYYFYLLIETYFIYFNSLI